MEEEEGEEDEEEEGEGKKTGGEEREKQQKKDQERRQYNQSKQTSCGCSSGNVQLFVAQIFFTTFGVFNRDIRITQHVPFDSWIQTCPLDSCYIVFNENLSEAGPIRCTLTRISTVVAVTFQFANLFFCHDKQDGDRDVNKRQYKTCFSKYGRAIKGYRAGSYM